MREIEQREKGLDERSVAFQQQIAELRTSILTQLRKFHAVTLKERTESQQQVQQELMKVEHEKQSIQEVNECVACVGHVHFVV